MLVVILGFQWTIWRTYTTLLKALNQLNSCYIRISMNNLKDIHNLIWNMFNLRLVVILGFQWTIWRTYTTVSIGGSQPPSCYIRISMNNLKDIHNFGNAFVYIERVVILGFQWTIWRTYTTPTISVPLVARCYIRISMNNLKDIHNPSLPRCSWQKVVILGFQWTIWRTYTTILLAFGLA